MKRRIFLFLVVITGFFSKPGMTQFNGGNSDGHALFTSGIIYANTPVIYCTGGNSDGHSMILSSVFSPNAQDIYCTGGNSDGHSLFTSSVLYQNSPAIYCTGGNSDGHSLFTSSVLYQNSQAIYCTGGNSDGHSLFTSSVLYQNSPAIYCAGGNSDGHSLFTSSVLYQNSPAIYCTGGNSDGHSMLTTSVLYQNSPAIYCTGGNSDGHSLTTSGVTVFGSGIWRGLTSSDWSTASNWINSIVPTYASDVLIPAGCPFYPVLSGPLFVGVNVGTLQCKSLVITENAQVMTTSGFNIYGNMNVYGKYTSTVNTDESQVIFDGGNLTIGQTGMMILGNQVTGTGTNDLLIDDGGQLNVGGGALYIDDQLNLTNGGTFNMTDGSVFIHKYGIGSSYSSSFPGSFWVESGALGTISGGNLKVDGKATSGSYSAVNLLSPSFDFTAGGTLEITDGANATWDETEIRTVSGAYLGNLIVDKPLRVVSFGTDALLLGNIELKPYSTLKIGSGLNVTVNGNMTLEH
jgi:hypothetical protein